MTINIVAPDPKSLETLKIALGITPPKPVGPTYNSESKGVIAISSMHYNHRVAAAKKMLLQVIDEIRDDVETLTQFEEFHEFIFMLPMEDNQRETLKNLTAIHIDPVTVTNSVVQQPRLSAIFNSLYGNIT